MGLYQGRENFRKVFSLQVNTRYARSIAVEDRERALGWSLIYTIGHLVLRFETASIITVLPRLTTRFRGHAFSLANIKSTSLPHSCRTQFLIMGCKQASVPYSLRSVAELGSAMNGENALPPDAGWTW